jgi:FAS-associated factor 2
LSEGSRKWLPDFTVGTYEDALRTCEREAKIGCVILVSEEHDDVAEFKRRVPLSRTPPLLIPQLTHM